MSQVRMICFGVREKERPLFAQLNKYGYELSLVDELLDKQNVSLVRGHEAVLLRGNCEAKKDNLLRMKELGVRYLLTRTVGYDHIDIDEAHALGFKLARVPGYSPNAISELTVTLAMMLVRHTALMVSNTSKGNFRVEPQYFSPEIRRMTVGILGLGHIGWEMAKAFSGLGAKVIAYDPHAKENAQKLVNFCGMRQLQNEADLLCLHMPYVKGVNYHLINENFLKSLKKGAILINTARGELVDTQAILNSLKDKHLGAFATDVLEGEASIFGKDISHDSSVDPLVKELLSLYPRVLITPHMGSNTDEACRNMIEQSFANLSEFLNASSCANEL